MGCFPHLSDGVEHAFDVEVLAVVVVATATASVVTLSTLTKTENTVFTVLFTNRRVRYYNKSDRASE